MDDVRLIYSEERGTWNVFVNNEWYLETSNYEQAESTFNSFFYSDEYEDYSNYEEYEDYPDYEE